MWHWVRSYVKLTIPKNIVRSDLKVWSIWVISPGGNGLVWPLWGLNWLPSPTTTVAGLPSAPMRERTTEFLNTEQAPVALI